MKKMKQKEEEEEKEKGKKYDGDENEKKNKTKMKKGRRNRFLQNYIHELATCIQTHDHNINTQRLDTSVRNGAGKHNTPTKSVQ